MKIVKSIKINRKKEKKLERKTKRNIRRNLRLAEPLTVNFFLFLFFLKASSIDEAFLFYT